MKHRRLGFVSTIPAILLAASIAAAAQSSVRFDLPAQSLETSLRSVGKSTDLNILIDRKLVDGLQAPALNAKLSPDEAISRLLKGTGLTYQFVNDNTVVLAVAKAPRKTQVSPAESAAAQMRAFQVAGIADTAAAPSGPAGPTGEQTDRRQEPENAEPTEIRVTGSRIRRDPAETDASPVTVFTREDIERSGAVAIVDFLGRITQSSSDSAVSRETTNIPTVGRATVNLRGLGSTATLILLNGRRLPKQGTGFGNDGYNIDTVPLASVERIEVLTSTASAIYGADAIGGVINIITRDTYQGLDLKLQYGNTFDSDVSEKDISLVFGSNGTLGDKQRKYSFTLSAETSDRNALAAIDRPYTALTDYSASGGRPGAAIGNNTVYAGAGSVSSSNGLQPGLPQNPTLPGFPSFPGFPGIPLPPLPPLPGLGTQTLVAIPAGQDGRTLTTADFLNSGPLVPVFADALKYRLLQPPSESRSVSLRGSLNLTPHMQAFVEGSHYQYRSRNEAPPPYVLMLVPAANPYNPFGVPVQVSKMFYELGPGLILMENINDRVLTGLRGTLPHDWQYELTADYTRFTGESTVPTSSSFNNTALAAALASADPATALNVFGDGRTTQPNDMALLRSLLAAEGYKDNSESRSASFQIDGALFTLPGGRVKLAAGGEYREDSVDFDIVNPMLNFGGASLKEGANSDSSAAFVELSVPLIGEAQHIPAARSVELSLAGRLDSESLFGEEVTPKAGLSWSPVRGFTLRGTYGHGYKVPTLRQLFEPNTSSAARFNPSPLDPVTGETITRQITTLRGGNPGLNPEKSVSWTGGILYEPTWLPQMSLSADYYDIDYTDRVFGMAQAQELLNYFPERVTRDPVTNLVTQLDTRAINLSSVRVTGFDVRLLHRIDTATRGHFATQLNYTYNLSNKSKTSISSLPLENVDSQIPRVRANANLFWTYGGFELGPTVTYEASTRNTLIGVLPARIHNAVVTDLQASLDFDEYNGGALTSLWTRGVKLTLGINNVFDREPSHNDGDGGYLKIDPRQRRFYMSLRKTFN